MVGILLFCRVYYWVVGLLVVKSLLYIWKVSIMFLYYEVGLYIVQHGSHSLEKSLNFRGSP